MSNNKILRKNVITKDDKIPRATKATATSPLSVLSNVDRDAEKLNKIERNKKATKQKVAEEYRKDKTQKMKDSKIIDMAFCEAKEYRKAKTPKLEDTGEGFLDVAFWEAERNRCNRARKLKDSKALADENWDTEAYRKQNWEAIKSKERHFGDNTCWISQAYQKGKENHASFTDDVQWNQRTKPLKQKHHRTTEQGAHQNSIAVETNDEREFLRARNKEKKAAVKMQQATQAPSKVQNLKYKSTQGSVKDIENNYYRTCQDYSERFMKKQQNGQEEEYEDDEYDSEEKEEEQTQTFHYHKKFKHGGISFSTTHIERAQARLSTKYYQYYPETNDDESDTEIYPNISRSNHVPFSMGRKMANDQTPYQCNCGFHKKQLEYGNGYATINYGSICLQSAYKEAVPRQTSKNIFQSNNRKNWSFSNERAREIQRHNQILMKKINGQKSPYKFKGKKGVES